MPISPEVEKLAARIEALLPDGNVIARNMFGGCAFMLNGNMLCGASKSGLMIRVGADGEDEALQSPHAKPFMPSGRRMTGFITILPEGISTDNELAQWILLARKFVDTLPAK